MFWSYDTVTADQKTLEVGPDYRLNLPEKWFIHQFYWLCELEITFSDNQNILSHADEFTTAAEVHTWDTNHPKITQLRYLWDNLVCQCLSQHQISSVNWRIIPQMGTDNSSKNDEPPPASLYTFSCLTCNTTYTRNKVLQYGYSISKHN